MRTIRLPRAVTAAVVAAAGLVPAWLLLVNNAFLPEIVLGASACTAASAAAALAAVFGRVSFSPRARWLLRLWKAPWWMFADSLVVLWAHALRLRGRRVSGRTRALPLAPVRGSARRLARNTIAEAGGSIGPNCYALGVLDDEELIVVHQLRPRRGGLLPQGLVD